MMLRSPGRSFRGGVIVICLGLVAGCGEGSAGVTGTTAEPSVEPPVEVVDEGATDGVTEPAGEPTPISERSGQVYETGIEGVRIVRLDERTVGSLAWNADSFLARGMTLSTILGSLAGVTVTDAALEAQPELAPLVDESFVVEIRLAEAADAPGDTPVVTARERLRRKGLAAMSEAFGVSLELVGPPVEGLALVTSGELALERDPEQRRRRSFSPGRQPMGRGYQPRMAGVTMEEAARVLERWLGKPVVDRTELDGVWMGELPAVEALTLDELRPALEAVGLALEPAEVDRQALRVGD